MTKAGQHRHIRSSWGRHLRREHAVFVARVQRAWTCGTASGPSDSHWADMWSTFSAHQRNASAPRVWIPTTPFTW